MIGIIPLNIGIPCLVEVWATSNLDCVDTAQPGGLQLHFHGISTPVLETLSCGEYTATETPDATPETVEMVIFRTRRGIDSGKLREVGYDKQGNRRFKVTPFHSGLKFWVKKVFTLNR